MIIKSYEIIKKPSIFLKYNLLLLYGENEGLKKDIKKIICKSSNTEILTFYENDISENEDSFYNNVYSQSLFSSKKIILINSSNDKILDQIEYILEKFPENVSFIIFSSVLSKKSKLRNFFEKNKKTLCVPCYLDNNNDLAIIARTELKKNNINLSQECINLLAEKSNSDRNNLRNEIEKIKSFALDKKEIEIDELRSIINFSGEFKSETLINECLSGNIFQYKKILSELYINTINQTFLLRILSSKIHRLVNMKKKKNKFDSIESLLNSSKPPIFWKEKPIVEKQLTIWNLSELINLIGENNNTEILCKKNPQLSKIIFFNFFTKLCKKANSYS